MLARRQRFQQSQDLAGRLAQLGHRLFVDAAVLVNVEAGEVEAEGIGLGPVHPALRSKEQGGAGPGQDHEHRGRGLRDGNIVDREGRRVIAAQVLLPPEREGALSGTIELDQLQLAKLLPFVPLLSELDGTLGGRLSLSGTVDDPRGHGDLRLTGGRLALVGNPTELEDLELDVDFESCTIGGRAACRLAGIDNVTVDPMPTALSTLSCAPSNSANILQIDSPKPVPLTDSEIDPLIW